MTSIPKTKVSILLFVVALISAWMISVPAFASETESDGELRPLAVEYTVAFDPDDGTAYPDFFKVTVEEGGLVTEMPPTPTREGYVFGGWAKSFDASDNPVLWDFATDTVQDNTTLWAVWITTYTVAFDPDDGTAYPDFFKVTVEEGGLVTEMPPTPTREGYVFGGWAKWFDSSDNPVLWDFATDTVQGNTTLWAVWTESAGGGGSVTEPQGPTYTKAFTPASSTTKATGSSLARTGDALPLESVALAAALGLAVSGIAAYALRRKRK